LAVQEAANKFDDANPWYWDDGRVIEFSSRYWERLHESGDPQNRAIFKIGFSPAAMEKIFDLWREALVSPEVGVELRAWVSGALANAFLELIISDRYVFGSK
jgi:hypothetical protein